MPKPALYCGLAWGIIESTLGMVLHLPPLKGEVAALAAGGVTSVGFLIWSPAAVGFMLRAYRDTGSLNSVMRVACLAAGIKLTNLFLPVRIDTVLNPAMSILLEGMAFAAVMSYATGRSAPAFALGFGTLWRAGYLAYLMLAPAWVRELSPLASPGGLMRFMVVENLVSSAVVAVVMGYYARPSIAHYKRHLGAAAA